MEDHQSENNQGGLSDQGWSVVYYSIAYGLGSVAGVCVFHLCRIGICKLLNYCKNHQNEVADNTINELEQPTPDAETGSAAMLINDSIHVPVTDLEEVVVSGAETA